MIIQWSNYEWLTQERWGHYHPGKPHWWYDPNCVRIDQNQWLHLETRYSPNGPSTIGAGLVCCETDFDYGIFEIEAKLPSGKNLWPAIWSSAVNTWPPEIDIMEAYSNNKGRYVSFSLLNLFRYSGLRRRNPLAYRVETCLHPDKNRPGFTLGTHRHWMGWRPEMNFIKYKLIHFPNKIEIYYNNDLVRAYSGKYVSMFKPPFKFKLNNGKTNDVKDDEPDMNEFSSFIISKFSYKKFGL